MSFRVATANVRDNPDLADVLVRGDGRSIATETDSAGLQEIDQSTRDHDGTDLAAAGGLTEADWWWNKAGGTEVPQVFRRSVWQPVDDRELPSRFDPMMHRQISVGSAGLGPHRHLSASFMARVWPNGVRIAGQLPVCHVNTHWSNKAHNNRLDASETWFQTTWVQQWERLRAFVDDVLDLGTISLLVTGDFNAAYMPTFATGARWAWGPAIDQLQLIEAPRGNTFNVVKVHPPVKLNSDHRLRVASLTIDPPRPAR